MSFTNSCSDNEEMMLETSLASVSIFGLGYVGTVTAACLAGRGHRIVGVDIQDLKVEALATGSSPIVEPRVGELLASANKNGLVSATRSVADAVLSTSVSIVCVGTPSTPVGDLDLQYVDGVCKEIARHLAKKEDRHLLILRSTMLPGSTRRLVEKYFTGFENGLVEVWFVPEFLREGTAVNDFDQPSLSVIGTATGSVGRHKNEQSLLGDASPEVVVWEEAEAIKYACNAFHAVKISFANEVGRLAKVLDVDGAKVMELLCRDRVLNISSYYLRPGNPYGGSCLPKDVSALCSLASSVGMQLPVIRSLSDSNRIHQEHLLDQVRLTGKRRIGFLGLSFKDDTDDLRNSCFVTLAESLLGKGYDLSIYDPKLVPAKLVGANRRTAIEKIPHLDQLMVRDLSSLMAKSDVIVVSQKCVSIEELRSSCLERHTLIDVNGWPELKTLVSRYQGLCW